MKVFLELPEQSRGIRRVRDALEKYAPPKIEVVHTRRESDLEIVHVIGRHEHTQIHVEQLQRHKKPYAMVQYCLRSTKKPSTVHWLDMWEGAELVWSYYDLPLLCLEDLNTPRFAFYHAPLGVDPVFYDRKVEDHKKYAILASSQHALSESGRECAFAVKRLGKRMFFLGHELRRGPDIVCETGLSDDELAERYSSCEFVSGLRRTEGFELPVIEGLMCGARPIVFDKPHYRQWFNEFAVFIPEDDRGQVIDHLERVLWRGAKPVSSEEKAYVKENFNWKDIVTSFWKHIL